MKYSEVTEFQANPDIQSSKMSEDCDIEEEDLDWTTNRPSDHNVKNIDKY